MDNRYFRDAMGKFATGITVVTTEYEGEYLGMTVNAFMSVSLDPRLIAISIDEKAQMYDKLKQTKQFGVSVLKEEQKDLSKIFARQIPYNRDIQYEKRDGIPVLQGSLATLSCRVKETAEAGDHMIFIAEVTDIQMGEGEPIIFYEGNYRDLKQE